MTDKLMRGMFLAFDEAADKGCVTGPERMSYAVKWLAENVTLEMAEAADDELGADALIEDALKAALLNAASEGL